MTRRVFERISYPGGEEFICQLLYTLARKCPIYVIETTGVLEVLTQANVYILHHNELMLKYTYMIFGNEFILRKLKWPQIHQ